MAEAPANLDGDLDDLNPAWPPRGETPPERIARLARERIMLEEAEEDIRQGRVIPDHEVDDWLDRLERGEPVRIPGRV